MPRDFDVCLHEAGHAAAEIVLGSGVAEVWAESGEGWCQPRGVISVVACLAGFVAEWHLSHPGEVPTPEDFHRNRDRSDVQRAIQRLGSSDGALLVQVWIAARRVVEEHWDSVLAIALELHRCGRLTGDRVEAIWNKRAVAA